MTVKELIDALGNFDKDMDVLVDSHSDICVIEAVGARGSEVVIVAEQHW